MAFSLTVPNFQAALPAPRYEAPQSNLGLAIGAGVLSASNKIAEEFTTAQIAKEQTLEVASALDSTNPQEAAQFRALAKAMQPNFLSQESGASGKIIQGLLSDVTSIIKNGAANRAAGSNLVLASGLRSAEDAKDFEYRSSLQSSATNANLDYQRQQLDNSMQLREFDKETELEKLRMNKELQLEVEATRDSLKNSQIEKADKTGLSEDMRKAILEGNIRGQDAKDLLKLEASKASNGDILQRFSESTIYPSIGTQGKSSSGTEDAPVDLEAILNGAQPSSGLIGDKPSKEEAAKLLFR